MSESKVEILNIGRNKMNHHVMVEFTFGETKANTHLSAMRYVTDEEVYSQMVKKFGFEKQSLMAIEEYSESTKTITKLHRAMDNESRVYPHDLKENFIEELVDVEIMVNQMKTTLDEEDMKLFDKFHKEKMDRCRKMLEE